ncbi:unnamed protein product [Paramecium pentaurelia]|uniref:Uncharacterized protein n=1 Tax=Paramecium pentaurelia TaxID=43138 RepID=A0A8S1VDM1_9CILI|nr:unnamed protein product [Paramecium pentaurelia]
MILNPKSFNFPKLTFHIYVQLETITSISIMKTEKNIRFSFIMFIPIFVVI